MFEGFRRFLSDVAQGGKHPAHFAPNDYRLAASALLVHAAAIDGNITAAERAKLRAVIRRAALPSAHRFQPVVEVVQRLEGVAAGNGVDDPPGLPDVGHGMVGLGAPEQLHHPLPHPAYRRLLVLASGLEPPTY